MPFNVNTPDRKSQIAHYLKMLERSAIPWDPEKYKESHKEDEEKEKVQIAHYLKLR